LHLQLYRVYDAIMMTQDTTSLLHLLRVAALTTERLQGGLGALHGLGLTDLRLMRLVAAAPGGRITRTALAKQLHVSASTVTRMAAPLEKIGVLSREADPRDARIGYVVLSPAGRELLGNANATLDQQSQSFLAGRWSQADHEALGLLLGRLTAGLPGA
jgi:DNA-binding MarR family transcriptional regulator